MADADQLGVASVSEKLYGRVTHYHAQIGHTVPKETLNELEWKLLAEAKDLFHRAMYEEALNTFTHCLAVTEKTRSSRDLAVRGAIVHNIASCLHHLGELEAAQEYYEQAIESFNKAETPMLERLMYGNTNKRRVDFVKERLIDISWGRKPDIDKYLDENAKKRPVPALPPGAPTGTSSSLSGQWVEDAPPPPWAQPESNLDTYGGANASEAFERRPRWLDEPVLEQAAGGCAASTSSGGCGCSGVEHAGAESQSHCSQVGASEANSASTAEHQQLSDDMDDQTQERARKEWLQYYQQIGNWAQAAELVVTPEEREDLDYLVQRERRLASEKSRPMPSRGGAALATDELYELNDAAVSASRARPTRSIAGPARGQYAAAAVSDEEDEDML